MRFIHTADWHLGRIFLGVQLTEDQARLLDQLVDLAKSVKPDAVLVAGDIYDRSVPPPEAVALLDDVLSRLVLDVGTRVVLIGGNHDSPERLAFGSRVLGRQRLHVFGGLGRPRRGTARRGPFCPSSAGWASDETLGSGVPLLLEDRHGPVEIWAVPYADPASVREWLGEAGEDGGEGSGGEADRACRIPDHDAAMRAVLGRLGPAAVGAVPGMPETPTAARPGPGPGRRSILLTHAFVAGGRASESERPLTVGGTGTVDPAVFEGFSYVALGHLHRPQSVGGEAIRYAGSLFKYSFDEADHAKSVDVVELNGDGTFNRESVPLRPSRDVRRITGRFADLLRGAGTSGTGGVVSPGAGDAAGAADTPGGTRPGVGGRDDYLLVTLLDEGPILDAMARLREVYPNVLRIERAEWTQRAEGATEGAGLAGGPGGPAGPGAGPGAAPRRRTERELFGAFFADVTGGQLSGDEQAALDEVLEDVRRAEREVGRP